MKQGRTSLGVRIAALLLAAGHIAAPAGRASTGYPTGVLTDEGLLAQTEHNLILGRVTNKASYSEFLSIWEDILKRARRTNIRPSLISSIASIKYDSPDNMELRRFSFDDDILPGDPMDNIRDFSSVLEESGLTVAGAFVIEKSSPVQITEGAIYYLTPAQPAPDAEIRLRYLRFPDPDVRIGGAVLEKAGVRVTLRQGPGAIFYIGRRLGIYVLKSDSPEKSAAQTVQHINLLKARKEAYIGSETDIVDNAAGVTSYITKVFTYVSGSVPR